MTEDKTLSTWEAARFVGRDPHTLYRWRKQGTGPPYSRDRDGRYRYKEADLKAFLGGKDAGA